MTTVTTFKPSSVFFFALLLTLLLGCENGSKQSAASTAIDPFNARQATFLSNGDFSLRRMASLSFSLSIDELAFEITSGNIENVKPESGSLYTYDNSGRLSNFEHYQFFNYNDNSYNEDGDILFELEFDYNLTSDLHYTNTASTTYSYDDLSPLHYRSATYTEFSNNLPVTSEYRSTYYANETEGSEEALVTGKLEFEYDNNGFQMLATNAETTIDHMGQATTRNVETTYTRDDLGRLENTISDNHGVFYTYSNLGKLESQEWFNANGILERRIQYQYLQQNNFYYVLSETEHVLHSFSTSDVSIFERVNCHPSLVLALHSSPPESSACMDRNWW